MDLKSFVTLESSEFLRNRQSDKIIEIENSIEQLSKHMEINPDKQFYKYGNNVNRLKGLHEDLAEFQTNPYRSFLCTRKDAYEAFIQYRDASLTKYYIMSKTYCSYGDMKCHLPTLLNEFEKEKEFTDKMLIDFKDVIFTAITLKSFKLSFLESALGWYKDKEELNIKDITQLTIMNLENLVEIRNSLIKFKKRAC